ncbi:pilus assembly protein [Candidatus Albibeggiatoa sp. nov. NOAA]|uniref:type II toxin-antitoxin system VapC family toxin n=1 Tax=Candidatus Albibeggiatoa sp. nov. NOAA TaxID=3162724 RepID=UPI0032F786ED|nr:PIN domain-containing protein [Thiotrichaceae bacterium]
MDYILIDSGPLIALFDASDDYHHASVNFIKHNQKKLITTLASITETLHLLDFNRQAQLDFLAWVSAGALQVETIDGDDFVRIHALTKKYADLPMDFADACLVFLGEKLNINEIATIDRDFDIYRLKDKQPFTTLIK